jgi:hypothetical protein
MSDRQSLNQAKTGLVLSAELLHQDGWLLPERRLFVVDVPTSASVNLVSFMTASMILTQLTQLNNWCVLLLDAGLDSVRMLSWF